MRVMPFQGSVPVPRGLALYRAYRTCRRLARRHYENFPVVSRLLPRYMRRHVAAVYAFARTADDFADEEDRPAEERHRLLDVWLARLRACAADPVASGHEPLAGIAPDAGLEASRYAPAIFLALGHTIHSCSLPVSPFEDLLSAFRQDIMTPRYSAWEDVLDYCRRSANPIGRLVLRIGGYRNEALDRASDDLCTALQLTNFLQDLAFDWTKGRLYIPVSDCRACGAREEDLDRGYVTPGWRQAITRVANRTRALYGSGRSVCDGVSGRLCFQLRVTWLGGMMILDRLAGHGYDAFRHRPTLTVRDAPVLCWRALRWTGRP